MPRDPRILRPAGNSATPFSSNAAQFDSDILMQDQHSAKDRKWRRAQTPSSPVTLHIVLLTKRNLLKHVGQRQTHQKLLVKLAPRATCADRSQCLFPSWKGLEWGSGLVFLQFSLSCSSEPSPNHSWQWWCVQWTHLGTTGSHSNLRKNSNTQIYRLIWKEWLMVAWKNTEWFGEKGP